MSELLRPQDFRPHLDKTFRVRGGRHALILSSVEADGRGERGGFREAFIAIFRGPPGDVLPEGLHTFDVEDGPALSFYIIPIHTPARDRQDYQAVFN